MVQEEDLGLQLKQGPLVLLLFDAQFWSPGVGSFRCLVKGLVFLGSKKYLPKFYFRYLRMTLIFWHPATVFHDTPKDRCPNLSPNRLIRSFYPFPPLQSEIAEQGPHVLWHMGPNIIQQLIPTELFVGSVTYLCLASLLRASTTAGPEAAMDVYRRKDYPLPREGIILSAMAYAVLCQDRKAKGPFCYCCGILLLN